ALLDELHRRYGGDRLGHRIDAEHGVERHCGTGAKLAHTERALVDQAVRGCRHRDAPRHLPRLDRALQRRVDPLDRFSLVGHCDLPRHIWIGVPAKAGTHPSTEELAEKWVPAFAGRQAYT